MKKFRHPLLRSAYSQITYVYNQKNRSLGPHLRILVHKISIQTVHPVIFTAAKVLIQLYYLHKKYPAPDYSYIHRRPKFKPSPVLPQKLNLDDKVLNIM